MGQGDYMSGLTSDPNYIHNSLLINNGGSRNKIPFEGQQVCDVMRQFQKPLQVVSVNRSLDIDCFDYPRCLKRLFPRKRPLRVARDTCTFLVIFWNSLITLSRLVLVNCKIDFLKLKQGLDGLTMDEVCHNRKRNFFWKAKTSSDQQRRLLQDVATAVQPWERVRVHRRRPEEQLRAELRQEQEPRQLQIDVDLQRIYSNPE